MTNREEPTMSVTEALELIAATGDASTDPALDPFSEENLTMGYGRERLTAVFDLVKDPENWKMPVDAFVEKGQATVREIEAAVIFFTGSVPDIYECEASGGRDGWAVLAAGYIDATREALTALNRGDTDEAVRILLAVAVDRLSAPETGEGGDDG